MRGRVGDQASERMRAHLGELEAPTLRGVISRYSEGSGPLWCILWCAEGARGYPGAGATLSNYGRMGVYGGETRAAHLTYAPEKISTKTIGTPQARLGPPEVAPQSPSGHPKPTSATPPCFQSRTKAFRSNSRTPRENDSLISVFALGTSTGSASRASWSSLRRL